MTTYAFIINYNRLTLPAALADYLADCPDITPVIVDNHSDYPPLLEYYEHTPHKVERMKMNYGCPVVWESNLLDKYNLSGHFVVTDADLDISAVPKDWLHVLETGLDKYKFACKAGFSLRISDLPDTNIGRKARSYERGHWNTPLPGGFYRANIDTTFCLCRTRLHDFPAVRSAPPYEARHVPWYYDSIDNIPEDELYYIKSTGGSWNYWTKRIAEELGIK